MEVLKIIVNLAILKNSLVQAVEPLFGIGVVGLLVQKEFSMVYIQF